MHDRALRRAETHGQWGDPPSRLPTIPELEIGRHEDGRGNVVGQDSLLSSRNAFRDIFSAFFLGAGVQRRISTEREHQASIRTHFGLQGRE